MSDHIRTALYDAKYQALLVNRNEDSDDTVTIAGKLCESEISLLKTLNYLHQSNVETILLYYQLVHIITLWHPITTKCRSHPFSS